MKYLKRLASRLQGTSQEFTSVSIEPAIVKAFKKNPDAPFLVSFPRTGSHWLRMLMELYFERPTLVRAFYYPDKDDFLLVHTHDENLQTERRNVIYLYREPIATIYSQLRYYQEDINDRERITYWSDLYGRHLAKWLVKEQFTQHKTILTYEAMRADLPTAFTKITTHFGETLNKQRFEQVAAQVTKEEVKRKTQHDQQVVQLKSTYQTTREEFAMQHGQLVWDTVLQDRTYLLDYMDKKPS